MMNNEGEGGMAGVNARVRYLQRELGEVLRDMQSGLVDPNTLRERLSAMGNSIQVIDDTLGAQGRTMGTEESQWETQQTEDTEELEEEDFESEGESEVDAERSWSNRWLWGRKPPGNRTRIVPNPAQGLPVEPVSVVIPEDVKGKVEVRKVRIQEGNGRDAKGPPLNSGGEGGGSFSSSATIAGCM